MVPDGYGYKPLKVDTSMRSGYDGREVQVSYTYPAGSCPAPRWALGHMPGTDTPCTTGTCLLFNIEVLVCNHDLTIYASLWAVIAAF